MTIDRCKVICHMMTSIDGKIDGDYMEAENSEYTGIIKGKIQSNLLDPTCITSYMSYPIQYPLPKKDKVNLKDIHKYRLAIPRAYVSNLKEQAVNQDLEINIDAVTFTTCGAIEIARLKNILAIVPLPVDEHLLNGDRVKELSLKNFNEFSRKIIWLKENTLSKCAKLFLNSIDEIDNNDN